MPVVLVEEWLFFKQFPFHRKKLVLHRASMKAYETWLMEKGTQVRYVEASALESDCRVLVAALAEAGTTEICIAELADDWLRRRLVGACMQYGILVKKGRSPNFLNTVEETEGLFRGERKYFQADFYIRQRKSRKLLLDGLGRPLGGKWSFDSDNRKKLPNNEEIFGLELPGENRFVAEARQYVDSIFPNSFGSDKADNLFVTTFEEADAWLDRFISTRLGKFGVYEDAMVVGEPVLYHSVLSPMLNIGLLDPGTIVKKVIHAAQGGCVPLNSVEGFIRQVVGWREFVHVVYEREGGFQRTRNFWGFSRRIPAGFWTGKTGIDPVDIVIRRVLEFGYCHHIERLMVLGNFMLLCEFDPDEVYRWFMQLFIDAYDWVMVPNVYGMSQYADGGLMTTKPYISSSNYLLKMGSFEKGPWQPIWDGLFWRFMSVHRDFLGRNPRMGMLIRTFDRMSPEKRQAHLAVAEEFLRGLDGTGAA